MLIIIPSPGIDLLFGILDRLEPMSVQALLAELPVEGFVDGIVRGLASAVEVDLHVVRVRPKIHFPPGELPSLVTRDSPRETAFMTDMLHLRDPMFGRP